MRKISILIPQPKDVLGISDVQKAAWLYVYPNEEFGITKEDILSEDFYSKERLGKRHKIINDPDSPIKFFVAKDGERVVGYCSAEKLSDYNKIRSLYVLPEFHNQGIGSRLINECFNFLNINKQTKLTVAIYNQNAISFYEKHGFVKGKRLLKNPEGVFVSGHEIPEMEMIKDPDIISRIKSLNLPLGHYCVFGSGVLEVHGIRKARDIDLIVDKDMYQELKKRGWKRYWFFRRVFTCKALKKDGNEAFSNIKWKNYRVENNELFKNAETIDGVPFMRLNEYLRYKRCLPREKDKMDVKLIEQYLLNKKATK